MPPKNLPLHQLLQEDQEPFHLPDYIADRRTNLNSSNNHLQLARTSRKNSSTVHFPVTFCKNACFDAKHDSPDLIKSSPVFNFPKSPVKMLHIPSKTAALLLEAALRIQKHSSTKRSQRFGTDLGFFGSVLKKLSVKTQKQNHPVIETSNVHSQKKNLRRDASDQSASGSVNHKQESSHLAEALSDSYMDFSSNGRRSDAEDKSLYTETSCSSYNSDVTQFVVEQPESQSRRCSSDFSFHPSSPSHRTAKDGDEEEKEQCSPVCVLDPLFEDDDGTNEAYEDDDHDADAYDLKITYANVQRKTQQLLHKLSRFEILADLDPKELEQLIVEDELDDVDEEDDFEMLEENDEFLQQVLEKCGFCDPQRIPFDMKKLISDLIAEEEANDEHTNGVVNTIYAKLESWKEVEPNTIDMMVDQDFKLESRRWKMNQEQLTMVAMDIELDIYGSLVREVLREFSNNPLDY